MPNFSEVWNPDNLKPETIHLKYDPTNSEKNLWIIDKDCTGNKAVTATVYVDTGVTLKVDSGRTIHFKGQFICESDRQVFVPNINNSIEYFGTVYGLRRVRPEWFGAKGDGDSATPTNDVVAFNRAIYALINPDNYQTKGGPLTFELDSRSYYLQSEIAFPLTEYGKLLLRGSGRNVGGSRLVFNNANTPMARGVHIKPTSPGTKVDFELSDFLIVNRGGCDIPLQIGDTGVNYFSPVDYCSVNNITVEGEKIGNASNRNPACLEVVNTRHVRWNGVHVVAGSGACLRIKAEGIDASNLRYTGDQVFFNTVLENSMVSNSICLDIIATNYGNISGNHFYSNILYYGDTGLLMTANSNSSISDTFLQFTQFEGDFANNSSAMRVQCLGSNSLITSVNLSDPWINSKKGANAILFQQNSGSIDSIWINSPNFRNIDYTCARFEGCSGIHITNPHLKDCGNNANPSENAFLFDGSQHFNVTGLTTNGGNLGRYKYVVKVAGVYTDWFNIQITDANPSLGYVDIDGSNVGDNRSIYTPSKVTLKSAELVLSKLPGALSAERTVQVGAVDSGGTGYRNLRVPN